MKRLLFVCLLALLLGRATPCQVGSLDPIRETLNGWLQKLQGVSFDPVSHRSLSPDSVKIVKNAGIDLYGRIVEYSLLIRRTEIVESPDFKQGSWSFPNLMKHAFHLLGQPDAAQVERYFRAWAESSSMLSSRWAFEDPNQPLSAIPLRLLAVVNRFDLGRVDTCAANLVCGAEFRFVYSGIEFPKNQNTSNPDLESSRNPYFTTIVEFVLPALSREEFQRYSDSWIALALPSPVRIPTSILGERLDQFLPGYAIRPPENAPDPTGISALERLLQALLTRWSQNRLPYVRIRTNTRVDGSGTVWQMDQRRLDPTGLVSVPLDQEPGHVDTNKCVGRDSPLGKFVALQETTVLKSSHNFYDHPACGDTALTTCYASLREANSRVLTLAHDVKPGQPASLNSLRFAVSVASCRGCHGVETRGAQPRLNRYTQFDQLKYREPNEQTALPPFLAGNTTGNASLDVWTVDPPPALDCAGGATVDTRNYNDLFRRFLYLLVVSATPPWPPQVWDGLFDRMNLPAFQSH